MDSGQEFANPALSTEAMRNKAVGDLAQELLTIHSKNEMSTI